MLIRELPDDQWVDPNYIKDFVGEYDDMYFIYDYFNKRYDYKELVFQNIARDRIAAIMPMMNQ